MKAHYSKFSNVCSILAKEMNKCFVVKREEEHAHNESRG